MLSRGRREAVRDAFWTQNIYYCYSSDRDYIQLTVPRSNPLVKVLKDVPVWCIETKKDLTPFPTPIPYDDPVYLIYRVDDFFNNPLILKALGIPLYPELRKMAIAGLIAIAIFLLNLSLRVN